MVEQALKWIPATPSDLYNDIPAGFYKGYWIALIAPNGGILGISVGNQGDCWQCATDPGNIPGLSDCSWQIEQAKQFIDQLPNQ